MAAVRYTFGYRGDGLWLMDARAVDTVAPLSGPLVDLSTRSGFWCELRDGDGRPLHRQALRDPRHPTDEVPGRQRLVPSEQVAGVFTVLVPSTEGATLVLVQRRSTDPAPVDVLTIEP
jgi:hypothetical protein